MGEVKDKGFESLEFYQDSLKLLRTAYRLADSLPNMETNILKIKN